MIAEPAPYNGFAGNAYAPAMAPRDGACSELPKLCTDPALIHGVATTLTYLCPEETPAPTTVHVTVTQTTTVAGAPSVTTTTVTAAPAVGSSAVPAPPK